MDFIYLPGRKCSIGTSRMHVGNWVVTFLIVHAVNYTCYTLTTTGRYRVFMDPFGCISELTWACYTSEFVILVDWFIGTLSIFGALIVQIFADEVSCLVYQYIYYIKFFMMLRLSALVLILPTGGVTVFFAGVVIFTHLTCVGIVIRILSQIWLFIDSNRDAIAIQWNFHFFAFESVKVHKCVDGDDLKISTCARSRDICPICFDTLLIQSKKLITDSTRMYPRFNGSNKRTRVFGSVAIFRTNCNHSFHRDCLMKWISGKPIRVDLSPTPRDLKQNRDGARCPVCSNGINFKISRFRRNIFQLVFS